MLTTFVTTYTSRPVQLSLQMCGQEIHSWSQPICNDKYVYMTSVCSSSRHMCLYTCMMICECQWQRIWGGGGGGLLGREGDSTSLNYWTKELSHLHLKVL